jgi:hypothetical protein
MKKLLSLSLLLLVMAALPACKKDKDETPAIVQNNDGFGKSTKEPVGRAFSLPAGVELLSKDAIVGFDFFDCDAQEEKGTGGDVALCMNFRNTTNKAITITLPAGLIFISNSTEDQNGLLIKNETIVIPANTTYTIGLNLYCINEERDGSDIFDTYKMGPITENAALTELIGLVKNKNLTKTEYAEVVQEAVWSITDAKGLTAEDRKAIAALPNL